LDPKTDRLLFIIQLLLRILEEIFEEHIKLDVDMSDALLILSILFILQLQNEIAFNGKLSIDLQLISLINAFVVNKL
jgi:hypothetical protein